MPVLHGMKTDEPSYLLGVDAATGKNRFRVERVTKAAHRVARRLHHADRWRGAAAKAEIVVTGGDVVTGHDPASGKELWRASGLNPDNDPYYRIVASPVAAGDVVVAPTRVKPMLVLQGLRQRRRDDERTGCGPSTAAPTCRRPRPTATLLYVVTDKGLLYCMDLATGKTHYGPERLRSGTYSSSPLLADGKLYLTSEDGVTSVVKAGTSLRAPGRERARRVHGQLAGRRLGPALPPHERPLVRDRGARADAEDEAADGQPDRAHVGNDARARDFGTGLRGAERSPEPAALASRTTRRS